MYWHFRKCEHHYLFLLPLLWFKVISASAVTIVSFALLPLFHYMYSIHVSRAPTASATIANVNMASSIARAMDTAVEDMVSMIMMVVMMMMILMMMVMIVMMKMLKMSSHRVMSPGKKYCYGSMEGEYCHCDYCKVFPCCQWCLSLFLCFSFLFFTDGCTNG